MLGVKSYSPEYVEQVRARLDADIAAFDALGDGAAAFAPTFFNNLVIVLDHHFCHRLRTVEGKDGNPLNEVRVLADSLMENGGTFTPNGAIKLKPETSVLGYDAGDTIAIDEDGFRRLADGFLTEIATKFA
jgi:hypothetical protein